MSQSWTKRYFSVRPYQLVAEQRLDAEDRSKNRMPPQHVLDAIAEAKLHGGYVGRKYQTCTTCFVKRSLSGNCNCQ